MTNPQTISENRLLHVHLGIKNRSYRSNSPGIDSLGFDILIKILNLFIYFFIYLLRISRARSPFT